MKFKNFYILNIFTFEWFLLLFTYLTIFVYTMFFIGIHSPVQSMGITSGKVIFVMSREIMLTTEYGIKVVVPRTGDYQVGDVLQLEVVDSQYYIK